jgi:DHA1 family multidrug resistance protein-like MFS transporter
MIDKHMIKKVFPILALCVFSATLGIGIISPLLPLYLDEIGASGVGLGTIMASYFISNSLCVPIAGRLSDRKGRKIFLTAGLLMYGLVAVGYIYAINVALLSLVRFGMGIAGAMTIPIAIAYLGDIAPVGEEGKWMGYANAAFFSGFGFGPLIGGVVTEHVGMTAAFLILIGLSLFAFLIALLFLPEVKQRKVEEQEEGPRLSYREMSASSMIRALFSFRMAQSLGRAGISSFLPIYAAVIGLSTSTIGLLLTINILSVTVLSPIGGVTADRFDRRMLTILSSVVFTLILVGIPLSGNFWLLLLLLLVQGLSAAVSMPAATAITVDEGRKFGMGSTMSVLFFSQAIGAAVGPIISGSIHDAINVDWVFYFGAIMSGIGTLLFAWFSRGYTRGVESTPDNNYRL